jgi:outer membrane receptor protein involved in Fe transport
LRASTYAQRGRLLTGASGAALTLALMLPAGAAFAQAPAANLPACAPGQTDTSQCKPATAGTELQTVVVTGSRIARRDYTSNSPIVTLSSQNLVQQADLQIQNTLNKLPQFNPDQNLIGLNTGDTQNNPTHSVGISTLSLRGLGANRNLVLVDGRRAAPVNASLVADINTIPTAMVDHVETITGGASATYGADAIGGVVNFVLKKNFHGVDLDVQYGFNQAGDGRQFSANALFGANFADDKGNITFYIERFSSDPAYQRNRSFYTNSWKDPTTASNYGFFWPGTFYAAGDFAAPGGFNPPSQAEVTALLGSGPNGYKTLNTSTMGVYGNIVYGGAAGETGAGGLYKNPFQPNGMGTLATQYVLDSANNNALLPAVKANSANILVQSPLDRWSFVTNGHYDFNDWLTATFNAAYNRTSSFTFLSAPISVVGGWTLYIPYSANTDSPVIGTTNAANPNFLSYNTPGSGHPVPTQLAQLLNSRGGGVDQLYCLAGSAGCVGQLATTDTAKVGTVAPFGRNAPWQLNWFPNPDGPIPGRGILANNQLFSIEGGLQGKIPGNNDFTKDWTWSAFGTHSESTEYTVASGQWSLVRMQTMLSQPGWAYGANITGNQKNPATGLPSPSAGFGAGLATCQSGFYNALFNGGQLSQDCFNALNAPLQSMNITKQDQVEFDLQGSLIKLPAGELKFAAGGDYRRDSTLFNPDILQSYNAFTDQVVGLYPEPYTNAALDVKEGYAELDIPILADLPFVKSFSINPGARYSTYSASKGGWTYKVMGDFQVNDWIRLRGGYNLAVRAPNIGELFQGKTQTVTFSFIQNGDPCSLLSTSAIGAAGAAPNPNLGNSFAPVANANGLAGAKSTYYICQVLMGASAAGQFYNNPNNPQPPAGSAFALLSNQSGNPNLLPETAHTYTGGVVLRSPIQNEWLRRLTLSIDYYKIHVDNAIGYTSMDYTMLHCFTGVNATDLASAQTYVNSNPFCQGIGRIATGGLGLVNTPQSNLATFDTAGVDLTLDWGIPLSEIHKSLPGVFTFSMNDTFLDHFDIVPFVGSPVQKYYGTLGPPANLALDPGAYAYRLNTTFGYNVGPASISLNWRHLPQVRTAVPANNTSINRALPYSGYDIFDLNGFFNLPHGLQLRASIANLFDKQPPTSATLPAITNGAVTTLGNDGAGSTSAAFYDTIGRRFSIGLKARF